MKNCLTAVMTILIIKLNQPWNISRPIISARSSCIEASLVLILVHNEIGLINSAINIWFCLSVCLCKNLILPHCHIWCDSIYAWFKIFFFSTNKFKIVSEAAVVLSSPIKSKNIYYSSLFMFNDPVMLICLWLNRILPHKMVISKELSQINM